MEQADLIWKNGEFVPWEDAQVHVLTHGLHYGTGVFEGIRCYETERGPAIFRHADHLDAAGEVGRALLPGAALLGGGDPPGDARAAAPQRPQLRLHPAARLPRLRRARPLRQERPDRRDHRRLALGRLPRRGEQGGGIRAKVSSWRRISPGGSIPHAKASGSYLNSILAKTESANAGYDEAILLDERGFVCEGSGENIFLVREGEIVDPAARRLDPRRDQPQVGDPDRPRPRLHRGRARHRPRRALPGRGGLPHRHRGRAGAGARDRRPPARRPRRDHPPRAGANSKTRCTGAPRSTSSGSTSSRRPAEVDAASKVSS